MSEFLLLPIILLGLFVLLVVWILSKIGRADYPYAAGHLTSKDNFTNSIIIFAAIAGLIGVGLRLYGFTRSLWLDEFGTLWAIEDGVTTLLHRVYSFQGQSPLYYLLTWPLVHLFGESEFAVRLISLIAGAGTVYGAFRLASSIYGKDAGLMAASFLWLSPISVQMDTQARPYSLAILMAVILVYGFTRAVSADRFGRWLFVFGGVGLFFAHYVFVLMVLGIALGYFFITRLNSLYPRRQFAVDIGLQMLLGSLCLPHIIALWSRREGLSWIGTANYLSFFELIGPLIILAMVPFVVHISKPNCSLEQAITKLLWVTIVVQLFVMSGAARLGINLLEPRYMAVLIVPAVVLAGAAYANLPFYFTCAPLCFWVFFLAVSFLINLSAYGSFSRAGSQDWRKAVHCLDEIIRKEPQTIVLYRSGFVEEDGLMRGKVNSADMAPLRSPAHLPVAWNLIPLTYSWGQSSREDYFGKVVEIALDSAAVAYFLTCARCFNSATGHYAEEFTKWIDQKFHGSFQQSRIVGVQGITLIRFVRQPSSGSKGGQENVGSENQPGMGGQGALPSVDCKFE